MEDFYERWEEWDYSYIALFHNDEVRDALLAVDASILKASILTEGEAAWPLSSAAFEGLLELWSPRRRRVSPRVHAEGRARNVVLTNILFARSPHARHVSLTWGRTRPT
eukprot:8914556-Pyramimonas_sp.AAC.1